MIDLVCIIQSYIFELCRVTPIHQFNVQPSIVALGNTTAHNHQEVSTFFNDIPQYHVKSHPSIFHHSISIWLAPTEAVAHNTRQFITLNEIVSCTHNVFLFSVKVMGYPA